MNPQLFSSQSHHPSRIIWIGIGVVAVCLIAFATVSVLEKIAPAHKQATSVTTTPSSAISAATIITDYTKPGAIGAYTSAYQKSNLANQPVYYTLPQKPYGVEVQTSAKNNATYTVAAGHTDNSQAIASQTSQFLNKLGLQQVTVTHPSPAMAGRTTYSNGSIVCQYSASPSPAQYGGAYSLTCVDNTTITQEYSAVAQLVSLYVAAGHPATQYTNIDRTQLVTDGNKSLAVVLFYQQSSASQQLFAAINGSWQFIVTLSNPGDKNTNGKYSTSPAVEAALNNPKYGDFLKDNVG